jgi:hypothetical protein
MPAADAPRSPSSSVGVSSEDPSNDMAGASECTYSPVSREESPESQETGPPSDTVPDETFNLLNLNGPLGVEFFDGEIVPSNFRPVLAQFGLYSNESP